MARKTRQERIDELEFFHDENERDLTADFWSGEDYAIELMYLRHLEEEENNKRGNI